MSQMPMEATYDGENALDTLIERFMADEAIVGSFDELSDDPKMEFDELVTNDETERAPRPVKKRRRVNRLKCDVEELRRTAERLGSELHVLQQLRRRTGASTSSRRVLPTSETTTDLTIGNVAMRSVAWQSIAMRQYQQLRESEMENTRLRMVLDEQLKIGQSLERLIRRGNYVAMHVSPPSRVRMLVDSDSTTHARRCYELQTVVHEMYKRIDQMMADAHFENVCTDFRKVSVHTDGIHAHEVRFVPTARDIVSNMIWEYFLEQRIATQAQGYESECVGEASNSIVKSFVFNWDKVGHKATYLGTLVVHRYREAARDIVVYCSDFSSAATGKSADVPSLRVHGWTQIKAVETASGSDEMVTLALFKNVAAVSSFQGSYQMRDWLSQLLELILSRHLERMQQTIDDALLASLSQ